MEELNPSQTLSNSQQRQPSSHSSSSQHNQVTFTVTKRGSPAAAATATLRTSKTSAGNLVGSGGGGGPRLQSQKGGSGYFGSRPNGASNPMMQQDKKAGGGSTGMSSRQQQRGMIRDPLPQKVTTLDKYSVIKVICGSDQTFCLTQSTTGEGTHLQSQNHSAEQNKFFDCFSWGSNQNAKLGHSYFKPTPNEVQSSSSIQIVKQPSLLKSFECAKIDNLSCGTNHSFAWSSDSGLVYGWGLGLNGRLGNENEGIIQDPHVLECFREAATIGMKVVQVSCGENHTLALVETGPNERKLFVWGNNDKLQLGLENGLPSPGGDEGSQLVSEEAQREISVPHLLDPDPFANEDDDDTKIDSIYASYYYSAAVTAKGQVYTWGSGEFGRLGYLDTKKQSQPRLLKELGKNVITKLSLGYYHAAAVSIQGQVFTWGRGINGQLGHGSILNEDSVRQVSALAHCQMVDISCGESHTISLTAKGEVYTWGGGQLGQLGHGDFLRQSLPLKVAQFQEEIIAQISCGKRHSAALSEDGRLFTWGSNEYGQLGRQANVTMGLYLKGSGSGTGSYNNSAKTSPSMNLVPSGHGLQGKVPNSTDNQMIHRFEFPTSKGGNSDGDLDSNIFKQLNKIAMDSVNLSWSQSPHQVFAPANRLHEISPYVSFQHS